MPNARGSAAAMERALREFGRIVGQDWPLACLPGRAAGHELIRNIGGRGCTLVGWQIGGAST
jgi:hypothetical protein